MVKRSRVDKQPMIQELLLGISTLGRERQFWKEDITCQLPVLFEFGFLLGQVSAGCVGEEGV